MKFSFTHFTDHLSPVLVKELRQGLRTRAFIAFFLILQALLILTVFGDLGESLGASSKGRGGSSEVFWFFIGAALLYFLPLRGFWAVSTEIKSNTLELIFLSHLTAWRIVVGKWTSLMAQTFLFVCAVLPYMLLRYFVGGINLIEDFQILLIMFLGSACLTAFSVAVSAFNSKIATGLFSFGGIIPISVLGAFITTFGRRGTSISESDFYIIFLSLGSLFLMTMLLVGASKIAPPAENFAKWKRIMALLGLVISISFMAFDIAPELSLVVVALLTFFICFIALGEEPRFIPSICKPFVRKGALGRLSGRFFYPGWPSGVRFTLCVTVILFLAASLSSEINHKSIIFTLALLASLLAPLALLKLIPLNSEGVERLGYFPLQIGLLIASYALMILAQIFNVWRDFIEVIIPHTTVAKLDFDAGRTNDWGVPAVYFGFLSAASLVILIVKMLPLDRKMRETEQIAIQEIEQEKQTTTVS